MDSDLSSLTIKIVGFWNTKIFHPEWFIKNFQYKGTALKNEDLRLLFNIDERDFGFQIHGVQIITKDSYIEIIIGKKFLNDDTIRFGTYIARKILNLLPETPIRGLGFNIVYLVDSKFKFCDLFNSTFLSIDNFELSSYKYSSIESNYIKNILISKSKDNKIMINFNFDYKKVFDFDDNILIEHLKKTKQIIK